VEAYNQEVRAEHCITPGCCNPPAAYVLSGRTYYSPLCTSCQDRIETDSEILWLENARRARDISQWRDMGIPKKFFDQNFSTFSVNQMNVHAYERCLEYAERFSIGVTTGGLIILGSTGVGKTHLVSALLKTVGVGFMVNEARLMDDLRAEYARDFDKAEGYLKRCLTEPLLVLDDFGSDNRQESTMAWMRDVLYRISNERFEEKLPTIVTTNTNMQEFSNRVGRRVTSRLMCDTEILSINDVDRRIGI